MAAGPDARKTELRRDVACPFCGLVCDDLEIEVAEQGLTIRRGACPVSRRQFERPLPIEAIARGEDVNVSDYYMRTSLQFETGSEKYYWLNNIIAVGTGDRKPVGPVYYVYEVI